MKDPEARRKAMALVERSGIALVGSNGGDGYPWIKAMLKMEIENLKTVWFSTNTSSKRVAQFGKILAPASTSSISPTGWA